MPIFALGFVVLFLLWLALLVGGLVISAISLVSGVVFYVRHKTAGPLARTHLALTIVAAVVGLALVGAAIATAAVVTNS